jgi:hypothetical protein
VRQAVEDEHGKIQKALWICDEFPEALEADLQRYYGVALSSLGADLSWRRLLVLVDHLPPEGALNTAMRNATPDEQLDVLAGDPTQAPWSPLESLMAALVDEIRTLNWMYMKVHSKSNAQQPAPISRPGAPKRRGRKLMRMSEVRTLDPRLKNMSDDEIRALMAGQPVEGVS